MTTPNSDIDDDESQRTPDESRRTFLKLSGVAGGLIGMADPISAAIVDSDVDDYGAIAEDTAYDGPPQIHEDYVYNWKAATLGAYWYSLYNLASTLTFSGNGVPYKDVVPKSKIRERQKMLMKTAGVEEPPVKSPNLVAAPFTTGDPHYTRKPDFEPPINANTRKWDVSESSMKVSPASVAWPMMKAVTWAKNFETHFGALPHTDVFQLKAMKLGTQAQLAIKWSLLQGNLKRSDDSMLLVSEFDAKSGKVTDETPRPRQHAAMLWFLSDMVSLAENGWYGYVNPEPLIPVKKIQQLTDGIAKATMEAFPPETILEMGTTRTLGLMLGAAGWYGTHAGSSELASRTAEYANALADTLGHYVDWNGKISEGAENQAATQGIVGQGLLWASQLDGVDYDREAEYVLGYMFDELWDEKAGTFASGDDSTYRITARDAGDVTGGINAADAVLGMEEAQEVFPTYFNNTFNRGRLMRAQLIDSRYPNQDYVIPLPPNAGGKFGQAPVYNAAVQYDTEADEWGVTDDTFRADDAIYLANQDIWISNWSGGFYQGRGIPGKTDKP